MEQIMEFREYNDYTSVSDEELMEMAIISPKKTGLGRVFIWVGPNPKLHGKRIKVSNIPDKLSKDDCFTITIPDFEVISKKSEWIDNRTMKDIVKFMTLNMKPICDFSDELISTDEFIDSIISIKHNEQTSDM